MKTLTIRMANHPLYSTLSPILSILSLLPLFLEKNLLKSLILEGGQFFQRQWHPGWERKPKEF